MLHLTPLEQTTAGKQVFEKGWKQGFLLGLLIGKIKAAQEFLGRPINETQELVDKSSEELNLILQPLECELGKFIETIHRV